LAVLDEVVDRLGSQDSEVADGAAFELLEESVRGAPGDHDFRTAGALERGYEVEHDRLHAVGADDFHCGDPFTFPTSFRVDAGWAKMPRLVPGRERAVDGMAACVERMRPWTAKARAWAPPRRRGSGSIIPIPSRAWSR